MTVNIDASAADEPIIVMRRTFDAPRDVVWNVFTDPKHVVSWYGGHGFSNPKCEMDVRPGGRWSHVMRTPDGSEFPIESVFVEVVKPEKLVWQSADFGTGGEAGPRRVRNTVTLEDAGKQTSWKLVALFESIAARDGASKMGFSKMVSQGSEKLNDIVRSLL